MIVGTYNPNNPGSVGPIEHFAQAAGFTPRITSYYTTAFNQPFALSFAQQMAAQGTMVLVQWQPRGTTNSAIASGLQDAAILAAAASIKSLNYQVVISYGQEMNGNWYNWGNMDPNTSAEYVAAYRRIWTLFEGQSVHNVTWLWDPNISYEGSPSLKDWYPGDQYVDWVGLDGYFEQPTDTFQSVFGPSIQELRSFTNKPFIIGETGVSGNTGAAQITSVFTGLSMIGGIGIVYFNETQTGDSTHQDWNLLNNPSSLAAFTAAVQQFAQRPLVGR